MGYEVKLDIFEGPLDLLLYLIKKNEINIYDIPIAFITEQYLGHLEIMKSLNLDLAGEYLLLASTLIHIKSKMLLPVQESEEEDEIDPREELVRQLLEYQTFKETALNLDKRSLLERDVFKGGYSPDEELDQGEKPFVEVSVFELVEAFRKIVSTVEEELLEINAEKMSLADRINEIMERLAEEKDITFTDLLGRGTNRRVVIYTFLAILEMMKLRMIRAYQADSFGVIRIFLAVET
ncbi:MAG: segregation/condensation protein A [Proteobacteria bacterium]|nr:segregation/condensation protein A [Pseudomonadota bacterium]